MGTIDLLARVFPCVADLKLKYEHSEAWLQENGQRHKATLEALRDQMANKELEMQRIKVLLEAERSNKPHEPRTIRPRTAAEMRRLVEHQNAEEMEQEAV